MKQLIIFNDKGMESARFTVPSYLVKVGLDYVWIRWKYNNLHKKYPTRYDCWDTVTIPRADIFNRF